MTTPIRCRYAVVQYHHDLLRKEPVNVGAVVWSIADPSQIRWKFDSGLRRVEKLYGSANPRTIRAALAAFQHMVEANPACLAAGPGTFGPIALTAPSAVRCSSLDIEVQDLFDTLVVPAEEDIEEPRERNRSYRYIKGRMNEIFKELKVFAALAQAPEAQELRIVECASGVSHDFDYAYKNGAAHHIQVLSFDQGNARDKIQRARSFANVIDDALPKLSSGAVVEAVVQMPTESLDSDVYEQAKRIFCRAPVAVVEVATDADLRGYCEATKAKIEHRG
jgi:hypothetical protein